MSRRRWIDRCIRWTTLWALVMATLAPSVAHALRHVRGELVPWSQLCSANGAKRVVFGWTSDGPVSGQRAQASEHCVLCLLQHGGLAPPPVAATAALRSDLLAVAPARPPLRMVQQPAWWSVQPRAPPHCV